jgi:hypothetical protein
MTLPVEYLYAMLAGERDMSHQKNPRPTIGLTARRLIETRIFIRCGWRLGFYLTYKTGERDLSHQKKTRPTERAG